MFKYRIKQLANIFCMVTTGVLLASALFTTFISPTDNVTPALMWQILLASALSSLCSLIFPLNRPMGKTEYIIRIIIDYLLINLIVLGSGLLFNWYDVTHLPSILFMVLSILIIYAVVSLISWIRAVQDAQKMNERLSRYQNRDNGDADLR